MDRTMKLHGMVLLLAALAAGCSNQPRPRPLTSSAFSGGRNDVGAAPGERATPSVVMPLNGGPLDFLNPRNQPRTGGQGGTPVNTALANHNAPPATRITTAPAVGASSGQFITLGGVVAEVNGTPIYANRILGILERDNVLQQMAKQLDPPTFRQRITNDIRRTIHEMVLAELEFAAAQRNLDADEKRIADNKAITWRLQQITRAGGSVEQARKKARDLGIDFEELVEEYRRIELIRTFNDKRIIPRIQVLAADIRDYYQKNLTREFSEAEKVRFRLLKVDIKKTGSKEAAINKINDKYKRAKAGEDFAEMVQRENDDRLFAGKDPWEMSPASFSIEKVREVLGKLQPGQISDIIEDGGAFYLVKLETRQPGRVHQFEDPKVQDRIRNKLRSEQYAALREEHRSDLINKAVVRPEPNVILGKKQPNNDTERDMLNVVFEMAMQKYALYAAAK